MTALFTDVNAIKFEELEEPISEPIDIDTKKTLACAFSLGIKLLNNLTGVELNGVGITEQENAELISASINSNLR